MGMKPITFSGRVEVGEGYAHCLGCPTANIAVEQGVLIPGLGVYVGETQYNGILYPSLVFINSGRTGYHLKMEVHLIDQNVALVGEHLNVTLLQKMRDVIPFPGEKEMSRIIQQDLVKAKQWFADHQKNNTSV